jgi:hypothetical protein
MTVTKGEKERHMIVDGSFTNRQHWQYLQPDYATIYRYAARGKKRKKEKKVVPVLI